MQSSTTTRPAETTAQANEQAGSMRLVWLLVAATFVVFLNETTMGVALRPVMLDLRVDERTGQWLTAAFMLTMAVVIPVTGFLIQRLTTRQVFVSAMILFSAGTVLAAVAPSFAALVVGRIVQASGTAIMLPLLMTTLMTVVPVDRRGAMMGNVSLVISVAPAVGPTLSGALLSSVGWRGIFWVMLPIGVGMLFVGLRLVRNLGEPGNARLDVLSVPLSLVGFGGLVFGLSRIGAPTSTENPLLAGPALPLTAGLLALGLFCYRQIVLQRHDRAMLDLRTFSYRSFSVSLLVMLLLMASLFGVIIVLPLYLLGVLQVAPLTAGLLLLPGGLLMGLLGRPVGAMYDRRGPRPLVLPGVVLTSLATWSLVAVGTGTPLGLVTAAHVVLSIGLALVFTPLFTLSMSAVPPNLYPHASALLGSLQQVAGAAGTALSITVLSVATAAATAGGAASVPAQASGIRAAFLAAAVMSLVAVALATLVRSAPASDARPHSPAGH